MKKSLVFMLLFSLFFMACDNYIVIQRDPAVLNSSIELSGEVTGDISPEMRTMRMHVTGKASNFLLVEIFGMETYENTASVTVADSLYGTDLYLSIIDNGPAGNERNYRNLRFWVGPFERDEYYTLHLSEAQSAIGRDDLLLRFQYAQSLDTSVTAEGCYYLLSEYPFDPLSVRDIESGDIPDFNDAAYTAFIDTISFFETDSGLLIRSILDIDCDVMHEAGYEITGDTLFMNITLGPAGITGCNKWVLFDYLVPNYEQQIFYYKFYLTNSDWAMFEGMYVGDR
jgi:hypothetical protein